MTAVQTLQPDLAKKSDSLFLKNTNQERFGEMLVEYRKVYANLYDKYPKDTYKMVDVMRL